MKNLACVVLSPLAWACFACGAWLSLERRLVADDEIRVPNILLIVADDLGFSDLGCYGGEIETPNLDRLAKGGLRLTQFYTTGRCCPSRASLLTGFYPHRVGLGHMTQDIGLPGYRGRVSSHVPLIAERVSKLGYRSFLSGKWHLGTDDPTQHGFEEFYGTLVSAKTFWDPKHFLRMPRGRSAKEYGNGEFYGTDALADHAIDFLTQARETPDQPWFLYLAFNAPHFPLHAPEETIVKYAGRYDIGWDAVRRQRLNRMKDLGIVPRTTELSPRSPHYDWGESNASDNPAWNSLTKERRADLSRRMAIYAAMVDRMDQNVGRVMEYLDEHGQSNNTLIVFTSDNGACAEWDAYGFDIKSGTDNILHRGDLIEQMGAAGSYHSVGSGWANASNTPWRLYKHFNHEGGIAVPFIVHSPRSMTPASGAIDATPSHLIDVVPTLLEAASGGERSPESDLPGVSLLPLLHDAGLERRSLFFEHEGNRAVRSGRWKLVALRGHDWELYDIEADRTERNDVAAEHPQKVRELSKSWDAWARDNAVVPLPHDYQAKYLPVSQTPE
ncbi:MAG: arylsulfatase [Planctomycetota bacterium]